jgi:hypothetical protein
MKNTLLALWAFILLTTPLAASAQQSGDFTYTSDGSAITITGLPVTAIGENPV